MRVVGKEGAAALDQTVRDGDDAKVNICNENHTVNEVMEIMTGAASATCRWKRTAMLDGIVSIGDVVKRRIEEVETRGGGDRAYIATA